MLPPLPRRSAVLVLIVFCWLFAASQASAAPPVINGIPTVITSETLDTTGNAKLASLDWIYDGEPEFVVQWLLCSDSGGSCTQLLGENQEAIDFRESWIGKTLRVQVTIYNKLDHNEFDRATSDPVGPIISSGDLPFGALIASGTVQMGVNRTGELIVGGGEHSASGQQGTKVGVRYSPLNLEGIADGSPAEGWGVADAEAGLSGWANRDLGGASEQIEEITFSRTADTAESKVNLVDADENPVLRVEHLYRPSASSHLFEGVVTITNVTAATIEHTKYRRVVDWDIEPTPFEEYVTTATGNSPALIEASDDGFSPSNPLLGLGTCDGGAGDIVDSGPHDCGAAFDFDFGALAPGASTSFKLYYGAAGNEGEAINALQSVGAEAYSLGQSSSELGPVAGTPATFILAFSGIGGDPLIADDATTPDTFIDSRPLMYGQDDTPQFEFHSEDLDAGFQCSLDGADWDTCASPLAELTSISEGWHNFRVRAVLFNDLDPEQIDAADETPATTNFKYDVTAPVAGIEEVGTEAAATAAPRFRFSSDDEPAFELSFECSVDSGPLADCTDGLELSGLSVGAHSLAVTATDLAGNFQSTPSIFNWTYAVLPPPVTTIATPGGRVSSDQLSINFTAAGAIEKYQCSFDGTIFAECVSPYEISDLDEGDHLFEVYAIDTYGQQELSPKQLAFSYETPIASPPAKAPDAFLAPARPSGKLGKPSRKGVVKVTATCNEVTCTVTGDVKIGKKKYRVKGKVLANGTSIVKLTFNKQLKKALKQRGRKKAVLTVVLSSPAGSTTVTKKF